MGLFSQEFFGTYSSLRLFWIRFDQMINLD